MLRHVQSPDITVELIAFTWDRPFEQVHHSADRALLNMCLTPRPAGACGRYDEPWWPEHFAPLGDMIFMPHDVVMRARAGAGRQHALQIGFARDIFPTGEWSRSRLKDGLDLHGPRVRASCRRILAELTQPGFASDIVVDAMAQVLAIDLARLFQAMPAGEPALARGGLGPRRLRLIDARLREPGPPPSVCQLAELCGISRRHLARAYRQETGRTLSEHIAEQRLNRAKLLLRNTAQPIKSIAADLGFARTSAFSAAFREGAGIAPQAFRQEFAGR